MDVANLIVGLFALLVAIATLWFVILGRLEDRRRAARVSWSLVAAFETWEESGEERTLQ